MFTKLPPVTRALLIANVAMFLLQWLAGSQRHYGPLSYLELWPIGSGEAFGVPGFYPWQVVTYGFLHADLPHILFNMLALVMFGAQVEHVWGRNRFLLYYMTCVVGAAACQLVVGAIAMSAGDPPYATVGASGGVFGLLLAYGLLFPHQRVMLLIPPVPMKARTLVTVYGALTLLMGLTGVMPGVAHFAHLGGMLFGWLLIRHWRRPPPRRRRPPLRAVH